jgi:hypothetical protein
MSSLKGLVIDGYVVGDVLGSGASGLLYDAMHQDTGRQAIVRVAATAGDESRLVEVFAQEAAALLVGEGRPVVRKTVSSDGRALVLLERVAPGEGHSKHAVTARLPDVAPRQSPRPSRRLFALVLGAAFGVGGIGAAIALWAASTSAPSDAPASPPKAALAPPPPPLSKPQPQLEPPPTSLSPASPAPASPDPAPSAARAPSLPRVELDSRAQRRAPVSPSSSSARSAPSVPEICLDLSGWKGGMKHELAALENYAAHDDQLFDDLERARGGLDYLNVTDAAGCARVERTLDAFFVAHGLSR